MKTDTYNKNKLLLKNVTRLFLLILLPLVTLGILSILITQSYIKDEVIKNNRILLNQASQKIDLIMNELDTLSLNYSVDPYMIMTLKNLLNQNSISYENQQALSILRSYIESSSQVKPYIDSIYIYYNNPNHRMISSVEMGLTNLDTYYDQGWYNSYLLNQSVHGVRSEVRSIQEFSFEKSKPILSLYNNFFSTEANKSDGVIVLNLKIDFIQQLISGEVSYPNQGFIVFNDRNQPLVSYQIPSSFQDQDFAGFIKSQKTFFSFTSDHKSYTISKYYSSKYGWTYLSITPNALLYEVPSKLLLILLALLCSTLLLGAGMAVYVTRNNYRSFVQIVRILDSAKAGQYIAKDISKVTDEHSFIIQSIVKAFVEQNYLKMQLSERKYKFRVMELLALQSQINPHFLYNTLHTISWKAIALTKKPNEVSGMIENLSTIMKYALSNSSETVSLDEEVYYTICYLNIQSVRYRNKFQVRTSFDHRLAQVRVLKLMLQPLIENSIYHGIKEKEGEGTISLKIAKDRAYLKIWVADNGLGMSPDKLQEIRKMLRSQEDIMKNEHIGLYNVNKRLLLTYGQAYRINIKSVYQRGTVIYMRIPIDRDFDANEAPF